MKKIIYTAITNNYDTLKEPSIVTEGWEYICYTNNSQLSSKTWSIIYNPVLNAVKQIRQLKIVPPFKFNQCIWIDGGIQVNCNLDEFVNSYCSNDFTLMKHPHRKCIYDEASACIKRKKDDINVINRQMSLYRNYQHPSQSGLVATGFLFRRNTDQVLKFCKEWNLHVQTYSKRDQLSFNFVARTQKLNYHMIPFSILEKDFILNKHNK